MAFYTIHLQHEERRSATTWVERARLGITTLANCYLFKLVNRLNKTMATTSANVTPGSFCCFTSSAALTTAVQSSLNILGGIIFVLTLAAGSLGFVVNFLRSPSFPALSFAILLFASG